MPCMKPTVVLLSSSGIASLFQRISQLMAVISGSVRMPTSGYSLPGIVMTSFGFGFSFAGMSAKIRFRVAST